LAMSTPTPSTTITRVGANPSTPRGGGNGLIVTYDTSFFQF
jgi:hypothetical protein